jgi:GntR family transcriptional regulator / MocR family aminotransferase
MRSLYEERQAFFINESKLAVGDDLVIEPNPAGIHLVGYFQSRVDDNKVAAAASDLGVSTSALSNYFLGKSKRAGLVLGYAQANERETRTGVAALASAIRSTRARSKFLGQKRGIVAPR